MKIIYLSPYDVLRPRTNQVSDIRFCESFVDNGCDVDLIVPYVYRTDNIDRKNMLDSYDVKNYFTVHYINTKIKGDVSKKIDYIGLTIRIFFKGLRLIKKTNKNNKIIIISRSELLLSLFVLYKKIFKTKNLNVIPWLHDFRFRRINSWVYRNANYIIATNNSILKDLNQHYKFPLERTTITLNPISDNQLKSKVNKEYARKIIDYKSLKPLIVYTGKLYKGQKEVEYIIDAAAKLEEFNFLFTGGKTDVIDFYENYVNKRNIKNCLFTGYIHDYSKIKFYQSAADLLISYYTKEVHDVRYNLPNKLCEYLLTGNPLLSPDFPATRDLLNTENAFFVEPENSVELIKRIREIMGNNRNMKKIGKKGYEDVSKLTYKNMTARIIKLINK